MRELAVGLHQHLPRLIGAHHGAAALQDQRPVLAGAAGGVQDHEAERERRQLSVACGAQGLGVGVDQEGSHVPAGGVADLLDQPPGRVVLPGHPHRRALRSLAGEEESQHGARAS